jgi:hypothetical protein
MHATMSADNLYLRFFSASKLAPEEEARRICREPAPDHAALLALLDGEVVGCGSVERGDARQMIRPVRGALLLLGRPGTPVAGLAALEHAAAGLPAGR